MAKSYFELLRDPRWQRKRLEAMQAADFKCERCAKKDKTLNVHHRHYRKGAAPWEYRPNELACLCEDCHSSVTTQLEHLKVLTGKLLEQFSLDLVTGYTKGLVFLGEYYRARYANKKSEEAIDAVTQELLGDAQIEGFVHSLGISEFAGVTKEDVAIYMNENEEFEEMANEIGPCGFITVADLDEIIEAGKRGSQ
ncbi:HNH endonuclease [Zavarzinella formosa]|uniref:HNH endonuclease n=1 Tax=Zavarzinella formosa TaxID=360055 RepID=UPI0003152CF4|nr:HNH endonuclease [Zavarzinella formosa]